MTTFIVFLQHYQEPWLVFLFLGPCTSVCTCVWVWVCMCHSSFEERREPPQVLVHAFDLERFLSYLKQLGLWGRPVSFGGFSFLSDLAVKNSRIISQCHWVPSFAWILEVLTVVSQTLHSLSHPPPPRPHPPVFLFSKATKDKELGTRLCSWAWAGIWNPLCQWVMRACWGVSTSSWVVLNTPEHPGQFPKQSSTRSETSAVLRLRTIPRFAYDLFTELKEAPRLRRPG